ncbi:hypothetical protein BC628DRAFT_1172198 [Trametes gibbosa]|nr:hypothetical protein BC628DRAFT_1172198 [Trametes gibbosa]
MIRSTPQGITAVKSKAIVEPAQWAHVRAEGQRLLNSSSSSNDAELGAILGAEYAKIVAGLAGRPLTTTTTHTSTRNNAPVASGSSARAAPQAAAGRHAPVAPTAHQHPRVPHPIPAPAVHPHTSRGVLTEGAASAGAAAAAAALPQNVRAYYASFAAAPPSAHAPQRQDRSARSREMRWRGPRGLQARRDRTTLSTRRVSGGRWRTASKMSLI